MGRSRELTAAFALRGRAETANLGIYTEGVGLWLAALKVPWLLSFRLLCVLSQHRCSPTSKSASRSEHLPLRLESEDRLRAKIVPGSSGFSSSISVCSPESNFSPLSLGRGPSRRPNRLLGLHSEIRPQFQFPETEEAVLKGPPTKGN